MSIPGDSKILRKAASISALFAVLSAFAFIGGLWLWAWVYSFVPKGHWAEFPCFITACFFELGMLILVMMFIFAYQDMKKEAGCRP